MVGVERCYVDRVSGSLKSTEEWRALARNDPFLAIACWAGKEGGWEESEFYATGQSDFEDFLHHWEHYEPALGGTCVEIGCGAGRVTRALAARFDRVIGLDVSSEMLELARGVVPSTVELTLVEGTEIPLQDGVADAVFSTHVLQHLDDLGAVGAYLAEAARVLRPGGSLMAHIPLPGQPLSLRGRVWRRRAISRNRRALARGGRRVEASCFTYRPDEIRPLLDRIGFSDIELRVFPVRSNGDPHPFWLGRRT